MADPKIITKTCIVCSAVFFAKKQRIRYCSQLCVHERQKHPIRTGTVFGRLTALEEIGDGWVLCLCSCGKEKAIQARELKTSRRPTRSCGCLRIARTLERQLTHGGSKDPEYRSWRAMFRRCTVETHDEFRNYGGRGITVCERWNDYLNFISDMGPRPSGHSIDRIDNNGNYEPRNCRWATQRQQNSNCRRNHRVQVHGKDMTVAQWCEVTRQNPSTVYSRLSRGWPAERAIEVPHA